MSDIDNAIDMAKLCDVRIDLAISESGAVFEILKVARRIALQKHQYIDPNPNVAQLDSWEVGPTSMLGMTTPSGHLAEVITSIRALKHSIRRFMRSWDVLHGEIDVDDLLIVCTLAEVWPPALDAIRALAERLGDDIPRGRTEPMNQENQGFKTDLLERKIPSTLTLSKNIRQLIEFLFPRITGTIYTARSVYQRVSVRSPTFYIRRAIEGDLRFNEIRDQEFLREAVNLNEGKESLLPEWLEKNQVYGHKLEQFNRFLSTDALLLLSRRYFGIIREKYGRHSKSKVDGFHSLWRCCLNRIDEIQVWLFPFLDDQLKISCNVSLQLVDDLYYYWANVGQRLVTEEQKAHLRKTVYEFFRSKATEPGYDISRVVNGFDNWALYGLVRPADYYKNQNEVTSILNSPKDWQFLAPAVVAAMQKQPSTVNLQVVTMLFGIKIATLLGTRKLRCDLNSLNFSAANLVLVKNCFCKITKFLKMQPIRSAS